MLLRKRASREHQISSHHTQHRGTDMMIPTFRRDLGSLGIILLALSVVSPGVSTLVVGASIVQGAGSAAPLAFMAGGALTLIFTFSQAELGSAFPLAGGDYATIGNSLGSRAAFLQFTISLVGAVSLAAVCGLGISQYAQPLLPAVPPSVIAIASIATAGALATLDIRTNTALVGLFLVVEMAALALFASVGLLHVTQPLGVLGSGAMAFVANRPTHVTAGMMAVAISAASLATSGAGVATNFSEEMRSPRSVGRLIMLIALITVCSEILPVLGIVVGAKNLPEVLGSDAPFSAFLAEYASPFLWTLLTLAIIAALFNALIATLSSSGRLIFSSARDQIWSKTFNRHLLRLHPHWGSPWVATLAVAAIGAAVSLVSFPLLIIVGAGSTMVQWTLLNLALVVGRRRGLTGQPGCYRAPLFPLTPVLSFIGIAALAAVGWQDKAVGRPGILITVAMLAVGSLYYQFVLCRNGPWTVYSGDAQPGLAPVGAVLSPHGIP